MGTKTIKNVDKRTWEILKQLAKRKRVKMGTLLRYMASEYRKIESIDLNQYLPDRPIISVNEAEELEKIVKEIRKESGFRQ